MLNGPLTEDVGPLRDRIGLIYDGSVSSVISGPTTGPPSTRSTMTFAPLKRVRAADQIAATIREAIVGGTYDPGDKLPSERDLADQFQANRSTVREAIHRLEAWGLVEVKHGGGTRVRDFLVTAGFQLMPWLLAPAGRVDIKMVGDLMELRGALLQWTAQQAALRGSEEDKRALVALGLTLSKATTPKERQRLDYDFFEGMVVMTDNQALSLLMNVVRQIYMENGAWFEMMYADPFNTKPHARAVAAILAGDAETAGAEMAAYARAWQKGART